jgi:pyruvate dehydrogenase E1 component alpha subunit
MNMATTKTKTTAKKPVTQKPGFDKKTYRSWFEQMLLMRRFEEKAGQLYGQQKIRGFCHLYIGQEACAAGSVSALKKGDKYITAYRDHAHPLALGSDPNKIMAELFGKETGISRGKGGSMHMFDKENGFFGGHGIVGGQVPLGTGIAFAEKYNETGNLCITYMGDGAVRQGAFHEALNLAMTMKLPVIFAIENNGYAMGTSVARTSNVTDLSELGKAYEMPAQSVDAMNVENVHRAVTLAATRARKGEGPTLLEFKTYRYKGHSMSDPAKYRTKEELQEYKQLDPIEQVRAILLKNKFATEQELKDIDDSIKAVVAKSVKFAEDSEFPAAEQAFENVYIQEDYPFEMG